MSNIKGLYFKLNMDNPRDKYIYQALIGQCDIEGIDKIILLYKMLCLYRSWYKEHGKGGQL